MSLAQLAPELHLQILSHLDLPSLLKVVATNHYFKNLMTENMLRKALMSYESAHRSVFRTIAKRPCYGCLRILRENDFFKIRGNLGYEDVTIVGITLDRRLRQKRRCYECDGKAGKKFERAMKYELLQAAKGISRVYPGAELRSRSILLIHSILA
jgi:hypothetical protein